MSARAHKKEDRLVWVDCEMTGLDVEGTDTLVEIAVIVTDPQLNIVAEGPDIVIHHNEDVINNMNDWCKDMFQKNGLTEKIRASTISMQEAENEVVSFLEKHVVAGRAPLAGSTVYMDRMFIRKWMPRVNSYLHYRIIDVSSVKELSRRWFPSEMEALPAKEGKHRALDDIKDSINELRYYRTAVFKQPL